MQDLWANDPVPSASKTGKKKRARTASPTPLVRIPALSAQKAISYHPTEEDHQAALAEAVAFEKKLEAREQYAASGIPVIRPMTVRDYQLDSLQKILKGEVDEDDEEEEDEAEGRELPHKKKHPERLTQAQRNRRLRQKMEEEKLRQEKKKKDQDRELQQYHLKKKEIIAKEKERLVRLEERKKRRAERAPRIGPIKIEPAPVDAPLTEDLSEDLAHVKGNSHLLREQFQMYQQKGFMEARQKVKPHRKYRLKVKRLTPGNQFLKDMGVKKQST